MTTLRFGDVLVDLMRPVLPVYSHVLEHPFQQRSSGKPFKSAPLKG